MFKLSQIVLAGLLVQLSGCAVDVSRQDGEKAFAAIPALSAEEAYFDTNTAPQGNWWQLYNDAVLNKIVSEALQANKDLSAAEANLKRSRSVLQEVDARRLPGTDINGGVSYGDGIPATGMSIGDTQLTQYGTFSVSWETDLFGRVSAAINAANADVATVQAARDSVRITVAAETTRAYLNACSFAFSLKVAEQSLAASQEQLWMVATMEQAGSAVQADIERAKGVVASARADIPLLTAQHRNALIQLAALMGRTPDNIPTAASECEVPPQMLAVLPVGDAQSMLRRRPDLRQAEMQLKADAARMDIAIADMYPKISLGAGLSYFNSEAISTSDAFSFSLGPLISWRFPNQQQTRARIRQAEAQQEMAFAQLEGAVLNALSEVEQALQNVAAQRQREAALQSAMAAYKRAFDMAQTRYQAGASSYLDVLTAQQDWLAARASHATSLQQLSAQRVTLFKALGGGWELDLTPQNESTLSLTSSR